MIQQTQPASVAPVNSNRKVIVKEASQAKSIILPQSSQVINKIPEQREEANSQVEAEQPYQLQSSHPYQDGEETTITKDLLFSKKKVGTGLIDELVKFNYLLGKRVGE